MAVRNVTLLIAGLVLVVFPSAKMSVVVAAVLPVVVVPLVVSAKRLRAASLAAQNALGEVSAEAEESLTGIYILMSFAQNEQVMDRFDKRLKQALLAALSRVRLRAALSGFVIFMVIAAGAADKITTLLAVAPQADEAQKHLSF
tara:strand:+ start:6341 stop:6772 length:432 start_codon:yes stop_codon:yes gene_type:complete